MTTQEFNSLFDIEVLVPLSEAGFKSRGRTLFWKDNERCLALIRLGGRMRRSNSITHVACFRHNFLRDLNVVVPAALCTEVFAYPFKFLPLETSAILEYRPQNLNFETEYIDYSGPPSAVLPNLVALRTQLIHNHLPAAKNLSPISALDQIRRNGEGAWIETLWIEDYERHIGNSESEEGLSSGA